MYACRVASSPPLQPASVPGSSPVAMEWVTTTKSSVNMAACEREAACTADKRPPLSLRLATVEVISACPLPTEQVVIFDLYYYQLGKYSRRRNVPWSAGRHVVYHRKFREINKDWPGQRRHNDPRSWWSIQAWKKKLPYPPVLACWPLPKIVAALTNRRFSATHLSPLTTPVTSATAGDKTSVSERQENLDNSSCIAQRLTLIYMYMTVE